jgi:hypothetical protein
MMRFFFVSFWFFLNISSLFANPLEFYHIQQQNNQSMVIDFTFPDLQIEHSQENPALVVVEIPGLIYNYEAGAPLIPVYSEKLIVPPGKIRWEILSSENKFYEGIQPVPYIPSAESVPQQAQKSYPSIFPNKIIYLDDAGIFRDYRVMGIVVYPVQVLPDGINYYKKIRVRITFPKTNQIASALPESRERDIFKKVAINEESMGSFPKAVTVSIAALPTVPLQSINYDNQVKLYVNKKGIYQITGSDLIEAGIDIQSIQPQTFRLMNKGKDVAIFVSGEQDQEFNESDYFEFLGEPNIKTFIDEYPDLYTDPFSDENVYWLSWGGSPGIRMVQESGAIVQTNPTQYNSGPFYPYTYHFEENHYFERFGYGNTHQLTYTRDSWFFDSGIQSIGKKSYSVPLLYPDSSSNNPVKVKVLFAGLSQTEHNLMVWLNRRLVGETSGNWTWQQVYALDNQSSSSIRSIDLKHGINTLEIQLPTLASGGKTDQVLFNWADITYDRQYRAVDNYIEFSRPSPSVIYYPNIKLFQFEIFNFTRSDIEIYKKGISKIVNYNLSTQGTGSHTRYKITFQDNIYSEDVEYIAVASNAKLKPLRIEKDEPFDEQNPTLTLKSTTNSADYVIVTHERFYDRAQELADLRRQKGLNVVMVKESDIYDEFNYGIKSPLAIKSFLKYAYYNWDRIHRLKYVLLLGDANSDYKTSSTVNIDFVPTFFYQTDEFGAVATDLPYAQVSGDDVLPDLFVGRIPVTTNGEITNIITKMREYEDNAEMGPWRNQTLFISGNDRSTVELGQVPGVVHKPAFRTQNQRVIDLLLDKQFTSFKLNTVEDTTLKPYDPNFGGTTDLIDYIDNGVQLMNFLGHGGGGIWADVQLLNLQDVERLNNRGKYPFVTSMTCFTGAYENPGNPGLAQKLLLSPEKGAIGIFASSGLAYVSNDFSLLWNVMKDIRQPGISIGESVTLGKIDYFVNSQYVMNDTIVPGYKWGHSIYKFDMIYQYNLIGDPYLFLKTPGKNIQLNVDNVLPLPGDTVNVQITAPFSSADGYLELANSQNEVIYREPLFYSSGTVNRQLVIPNDSIRGTNYIRAYLTDNVTDASNYQQIAVNYSLFDSVKTIPSQPNAEDSVGISLVVKDGQGVSNVKVVAVLPAGVVLNGQDTLHINTRQVGQNTFETVEKIPPTFSISTVYFFVYATNSLGQVSRMNYNYRVVETRPDPLIYRNGIKLVGNDWVRLGVSIGNSGRIAAQDVELKVYNGYENYVNNIAFATQSVTILGKDSLSYNLDFPLTMATPEYHIYASLNRNGVAPDFNPSNNLDSSLVRVNIYQLTPELGSTYDNQKNDTIRIGSDNTFWLGPGSIFAPSAALLDLETAVSGYNQSKLIPIPLQGYDSPVALNMKFFNSNANLSLPYKLRLVFNSSYVQSHNLSFASIKLYKWDSRIQTWLQQDAAIDSASSSVQANLNQDGLFTLFISGDAEPPRIELTIDGRRVQSETLVSPNPVLNVIVEDETGLNVNRDEINIVINDVAVPSDKVFIPDSVTQSNVLGITVYPELTIGSHKLDIQVKDVNGNSSSREFKLLVSDAFDLKVFGNYPNPFSDQTIFSYYLTSKEIVDDFEIRIFTVSGRLIKRIKNDANTRTPGNDPRRQGYNELIWDGTDQEGNQVANGVYFALIRAKYEDKEKTEILKVAKLR